MANTYYYGVFIVGGAIMVGKEWLKVDNIDLITQNAIRVLYLDGINLI